MFSYVDAALTWSDLSHIRKLTGLPLIVKGIQTASDAAMAVANGVEAIYLYVSPSLIPQSHVYADSRARARALG